MVGVITVAILNPLTAQLTGKFEDSRAALVSGAFEESRQTSGCPKAIATKRILIHADSSDSKEGEVRLKGVSMFIYTLDAKGGMNFTHRLDADEATLHPGYWSLTNVSDTIPGGVAQKSVSTSIPTNLEDGREVERIASPNSISAWDLPSTIRRTEQAGFSSLGYRLRLHQLLAMPILFAAMSILAAAFSLRLMRLARRTGRPDQFRRVALGFIFFFMNKFLDRSWAKPEPALARPSPPPGRPPMLALLCGLTLLSVIPKTARA